MHYSDPELHDLTNYGGKGTRMIVPAHIWKKHNPVKWTNKKPVGTGPYTLESFGAQSVKLKVRDDYWHGSFNGVKHVNIKAFGSDSADQQMMLKNKLSWSTVCWKDYKKDFIKQDPEHNRYYVAPEGGTGGTEGIVFNTAKKPTSNVHIRRALYAAIDSHALVQLFDYGEKAANPTGLDGKYWGDYMPASLRNARHEQDTDKATTELKASGFKVKNGKLVKGGKSFPLTLRINADSTNWSAWAPALKSQWKHVLGLNVSIKKSPLDQLGEYQQDGNFQMLYDFLNNQSDIWSSLHSQLSGSYRKPLGQAANGNYGRYHNDKVDTLLAKMAHTRDPKKLQSSVSKIVRIVTQDVPYAAVDSSPGCVEVNSTDWSGWPDPDHLTYWPHTLWGPDATLTIQHLKPNSRKGR